MPTTRDPFLQQVDLFVFAPVNTFLFLDTDKIELGNRHRYTKLRTALANQLNGVTDSPSSDEPFKPDDETGTASGPVHGSYRNPGFGVRWGIEESQGTKRAKGVFQPSGKDNSFLMAQLLNERGEPEIPAWRTSTNRVAGRADTEQADTEKADTEKAEAEKGGVTGGPDPGSHGPAGFQVVFTDVYLYFHIFGISTISARAVITSNRPGTPTDQSGFTVAELEDISEQVNYRFKELFETPCFQISTQYEDLVARRQLQLSIDFLPRLSQLPTTEVPTNVIPWTHRIYHIHDPELFKMDNPGLPFRNLLTPSRQMDVHDLSIYDNRYIYFGWGHSVIITRDYDGVYSQTDTAAADYVRLVEIAQANWQCLDLLGNLIDRGKSHYRNLENTMRSRDLSREIHKLSAFASRIREVLEQFTELKITFDTEKRSLLQELHERWHTSELLTNAGNGLDSLEQYLSSLNAKKQQQSDATLNNVLFVLAVLALLEVLNTVIEKLPAGTWLGSIGELALLGISAALLLVVSVLYLWLK